MPKAIVHLDADAFFASMEQAADSRLRGKPVAMGGEKRGFIISASLRLQILVPAEKSREFHWFFILIVRGKRAMLSCGQAVPLMFSA